MNLTVCFDNKRRTFALNDRAAWRIGRSPSCEVHVQDPYISSEHAVLEIHPGGLRLRQTGGSNPILVDGRRTPGATLSAGSIFTIGMTSFMVGPIVLDLNDSATGQDVLSEGATFVQTDSVLGHASSQLNGTVSMNLVEDLTRLLSQANDIDTLARSILEIACLRLDASRAFVGKALGGDRVEIVAFVGFQRHSEIPKLVSRSVLRSVLKDTTAVLIGDTEERLGLGEMTESVIFKHIRAVACAPILNLERKLDAMLYVDNLDRPAEFCTRDAEFLIWIGHFYWLLARNIESRRALEAEIADLKHALELKKTGHHAPVP